MWQRVFRPADAPLTSVVMPELWQVDMTDGGWDADFLLGGTAGNIPFAVRKVRGRSPLNWMT